MKDFVYIIGSRPYGVSSLLQSDLAFWRLILFQQKKSVADSEANVTMLAAQQGRSRMWANVAGDGCLARPVPANGVSANIAIFHDGSSALLAIVNGEVVELRNSSDGNQLSATLAAPPSSGTRMDMIFLDVWNTEVQPATSPEAASTAVYKRGNVGNSTTLTNDLVSAGVGTETSRRIQLRYQVRALSNCASLVGQTVDGYVIAAGTRPGEFLRGDGSTTAAQALGSVDGYRLSIPLATVQRSAGVTTIPASAITAGAARQVVLSSDADTVDLIHAAATPTTNKLLPLNGSGVYPSSVFTGLPGSGADVDLVDGFHASATPIPNTLLPLDSSIKLPNIVLKTGSGGGLDADSVDGIHAAATPTANKLPVLDALAKFANSMIRTGSGGGLDADSVDGIHAASLPAAGKLLAMDGTAKTANTALRTGSGGGIDADSVDGFHVGSGVSNLWPADNNAKLANSRFYTGAGNGLNADKVDGQQPTAWSATTHTHGLPTFTWRYQEANPDSSIYHDAGGDWQWEFPLATPEGPCNFAGVIWMTIDFNNASSVPRVELALDSGAGYSAGGYANVYGKPKTTKQSITAFVTGYASVGIGRALYYVLYDVIAAPYRRYNYGFALVTWRY